MYPDEACGLLAGKDICAEKTYTMTNIERSNVSYMMDPAEQFNALKDMRKNSSRMIAIYHSHPHSAAYPSPKVVSLAFHPDAFYLIIGLSDINHPEVKAYTIIDGEVTEIPIEYSVDASSLNPLK